MTLTAGRRAVLAVGVPLVCVLLAGGAVNVVSLAASQVKTMTRTYPAGAGRVVVDTGAGAVSVRTGPAGTVTVRSRLRWSFRAPRLTGSAAPDGVHLRARCTAVADTCSAGYDLTVPAGTALDIRASDAVHVRGVRGPIRVSTSSGRVSVAGSAGPLTLHTGDGAITGTELGSAAVWATSSSGRLTLAFAAAPTEVSARSGDGAVTITVPRGSGPYRVEASTGNGATRVTVPVAVAASRHLLARTSSGRVSIG